MACYTVCGKGEGYEIFHTKPLCSAPDGRIGLLRAGQTAAPQGDQRAAAAQFKVPGTIVTPLARAGLVKSERGSQGGYRLVKPAAEYTAGEILRAMEGSVAPIPCLESEVNECPLCGQCFTLPFWTGLDEVINQYMDSVTLADLAHSLRNIQDPDGQNPTTGGSALKNN